VLGEIEKTRQILGTAVRMAGVGEAAVRIAELVKEGVDHGIDGRETLSRRVLEQRGDQIDSLW